MDEDETEGKGPPAATRVPQRWRAAILLGLPAVILVAGALLLAASERKAMLSGDGVVVIADARVAIRIGDEQHSERVRLPYHWDSAHPGDRGSAVFDLAFDLADVPTEPWAMQFRKIGNAYQVSLNGTPLESRGELNEHDGSDSSLLPRHLPLGVHLRPGTNHLAITIRADRGRDAGLSKVIVGPAGKIRDDAERRYNWTVVSTTAVTAVSLGVGLLSLGLWRSRTTALGHVPRKDDALYLYAALAELAEAIAAGGSLVGTPPLPWPWWGALWNTTLGASIGLMTLSCVVIAGWDETLWAKRLRRWLAALVLICPAMSYAAFGLGEVWALSAWYSTLGMTVVGFAGLFVARAVRGATLEHQLVSIAIVANLAAGFYDFYAFQSAGNYLHITMLVYSSILFDLTLGAIVILRFRAASTRVGELLQSLSIRVTDRERELGESYRKLEQLARRQ